MDIKQHVSCAPQRMMMNSGGLEARPMQVVAAVFVSQAEIVVDPGQGADYK